MFTLYLWHIRTIFVYVMFTVFTFRQKKLSYIPKKYLEYNVRKDMVGQSEDVPWTFECLVGYCFIAFFCLNSLFYSKHWM